MRWLPLLVALGGTAAAFGGTAAADSHASNPAFLGIGLQDAGIGCMATRILGGGPARDAGLHDGDLIVAFDGKPLAGTAIGPCSELQASITSHAPGDTVRLDVRRGMDPLAMSVTLASRAEVAHRRFVGHPLALSLVDADDPRRTHDPDDMAGNPIVLGVFNVDGCVGCGAVFDRLRDALRKRLGDDQPQLFAVTPTNEKRTTPLSKLYSSSVPLVFGPDELFQRGDLFEADRI